MIILPSEDDKFGFYQVGTRRTYSKLEAVEWSLASGQKITWNFNEQAYALSDWSQEPTESLQELYRRRAQQIRDKYDYIVLLYSGGYDSSNMLYAFLDNGIKVDEVMTFYSREDQVSPQHIEIKNFTLDKIEKLKVKYPEQKFTMLDYHDQYLKWHDIDPQIKLDYQYLHNCIFSANRLVTNSMMFWHEDYKQIIDKDQKLCFLWASDKIKLLRGNDGWACVLDDTMIDSHIGVYAQMNGLGRFHEFFYFSPELPELIIKQTYQAKKYHESSVITTDDNIELVDGKNFHIYQNFDNVKAVYPRLFVDNEKFFEYKNPVRGLGNRDQWFVDANHDSSAFWRKVMNDFLLNKGKSLGRHYNKKKMSLTRIYSPIYYIT